MTILDRGATAKNKEDATQSRQSNLDNGNSNRKQRNRSSHAPRSDRVLSHGLSVPNAATIETNYRPSYWEESSASHRSSEYVDTTHDEHNTNEQRKPRGLAKSTNVVHPPNPEVMLAGRESSAMEDIPHPANTASSEPSHSVSFSAKNQSRMAKKQSDKKVSHKKKRRNAPYQGKAAKGPEKLASHSQRSKLVHSKSIDNKIQKEASNVVAHAFPSAALLNADGSYHKNHDIPKRYRKFSAEKSEFVNTRDIPNQYNSNVTLFPKGDISRSPTAVVDDTIDASEHVVYTNSDNDARHNSDDEHDQGRLKRLNKGIDFKKVEEEFEEKLKKERGFTIKAMGEDGACLFRAVADHVYGDQNMHDEVRKNCMNYMNKNADYFKNYVTEDFEEYVKRKRNVHEFGNHLEMQAMAELYNRPFEVYQYSTEPINTFQTSSPSANAPIRVSYHQNSHYNAVIDPYVATIGVGLGLPSFTPGLVDKNMLNDAVKASCEVWEQQMLNDKVQATDWENTDDAILEQVARESYMEYLEQENTDTAEKDECENFPDKISDQKDLEKSDQTRVVKEFPKKPNKAMHPPASDWVAEEDEWQVLSQVLANSQQEYMDALKHQATHSTATCSKYT